MPISQIVDCEYVNVAEIINKSILIKELNEFNIYYYLTRNEYNNVNTIVY